MLGYVPGQLQEPINYNSIKLNAIESRNCQENRDDANSNATSRG